LQEMEANAGLLDESLLATTTAWMRKADKDKLDGQLLLFFMLSAANITVDLQAFSVMGGDGDMKNLLRRGGSVRPCCSSLPHQRPACAGMVALLQQVLQLYAARALVVNSNGSQVKLLATLQLETDQALPTYVTSSLETCQSECPFTTPRSCKLPSQRLRMPKFELHSWLNHDTFPGRKRTTWCWTRCSPAGRPAG
jgi:hypothetical protein